MNRDWKILDLMSDGDKAVDGIGPIKSVRRLSDDKIFSIGDKTTKDPSQVSLSSAVICLYKWDTLGCMGMTGSTSAHTCL